MTIYEINYRNRLNEMVNLITDKYGANHNVTILFTHMVEQRLPNANYQNREELERYFKGWMK